jgi:hypothetical protein
MCNFLESSLESSFFFLYMRAHVGQNWNLYSVEMQPDGIEEDL